MIPVTDDERDADIHHHVKRETLTEPATAAQKKGSSEGDSEGVVTRVLDRCLACTRDTYLVITARQHVP